MQKFFGGLLVVLCGILWSFSASASDIPIIASLSKHGIAIQKMDNQAMQQSRGAILPLLWQTQIITNHFKPVELPYASLRNGVNRQGMTEFRVKYKGTGSQFDYRSYRWMSQINHPGEYILLIEAIPVGSNGTNYNYYVATGDIWRADMDHISTSWGYVGPVLTQEEHYLIVDPDTGAQYPYNSTLWHGANYSWWDRPKSTFSW